MAGRSGYDIPDGPRGNNLWMTNRFMRNRGPLVRDAHARYGDTFSVQILPGPRTIVIFSDPADVKEIFSSDPSQFYAGQGNAILKPVMGDHSLLLVDGEEHTRARKLLMPAFTGPAMRGYRPLVEGIAKQAVESWEPGQRIVTLDAMNAITLDVILQVVFGVTDEERLTALRPRFTRIVDIDASVLLSWIFPRLRKVPPWRGFFTNLREVDELLYAVIRERRQAHDLEGRDDVLSRLLRVGDDDPDTTPLTDEEMRDQLVTLLLAGHETTASALSWTLHELGLNPELLKRALVAADTGDEAFLEACVKEAMRLHPIIDFVARTLQSDQTVGGRRLPKGTTVAPSIMLSHSREATFADAHEYRPDRFLDADAKVSSHTWIPFGGGVRRCIGAAFSLMEGTVVLREVLLRHGVFTEQPTAPRLRNITNVPDDKAPVVLLAR
ncbi:cytochrome P450 [Aeromicrobium sp. Root495]|uniref:cytochrome P450 n=1 Tax=Aeromicrobium sp. Root495 TaxID=1736550 RepID=UPI0006F246A6|nr:cytochrome P450 [Aeromicrobium sp. Root495]KQY60454.1 cytochrome P450 [Aeromicrobium sp. Root495]